jgi:hypothetical protein
LIGAAEYYKLVADHDAHDTRASTLGQLEYAFRPVAHSGYRIDLDESAKYFTLVAGVPHNCDTNSNASDGETGFSLPIRPMIARALCSRAVAVVDSVTADVLNWLGDFFKFGQYTIRNVALAAECYCAAAKVGNPVAQLQYGLCLEHGLGVERDVSKSFEFFEASMCADDPVAAGHCALSVHFGVGVWEDLELANNFYDSDQNCEPPVATQNIARCRGLSQPRFPAGGREGEPVPPVLESARQRLMFEVGGLHIPEWMERHRVGSVRSRGEQVLGYGAYGKVILVEGVMKTAVKQSLSWNDRHTFLQEIASHLKLRHPCIIRIYGWSLDGSKTFEIQMQYAQNGSLRDYLEGSRHRDRLSLWSPTRKGQVICDIALGMRYIHSQKIIHGDLTPANIFLSEKWRGLIGDFGLSRFASADGRASPSLGTPLYAAPEQLNHSDEYTAKVDVFAFGLILYEIIANVPAFPQYRSRPLPPIPDTFGPLMKPLIARCWSLAPIDRPSFQDIFDAFERCEFAVLPGADAEKIRQSVSEVIRMEQGVC